MRLGVNINRINSKPYLISKHITIFCNICGKLKEETEKKRLVRDHNHNTGIIRGILCDICNQMLGVYESLKKDYILNDLYNKRTKKKYLLWENRFKNRIIYHLKCNTGYKYTNKVYIPFELLIH